MTAPTRVLLITSNGAGMGHLTRQLSVALAAGARVEATLFSLSVALPVVAAHGIPGEYCPSVERQWMPSRLWHGYLRERIVAAAAETGAEVIAFDGVAPYPGILGARAALRDVPFVWMRRGMWRPGVNAAQLRKAAFFDRIIEPGDLASAADRGPTAGLDDAVPVPPISMLEVVPRLPRRDAATRLGIDADRPTVLVTLGSGRLGAVEAPGAVVLEALLQDPEWQVCVTKPAIAQRTVAIDDPARVRELRGVYPLVRYLDAFDAVVSAAGYNAVHEFLPAALPTVLVPNPATRTDDQVARANTLAAEGLALAAHPEAATDLAAAVSHLSDRSVRSDLTDACGALPQQRRSGGAARSADLLVELARDFAPRRLALAEQPARLDIWWRETAKRILGDRGTEMVRRLLGRSHTGLPHRLPVRVVTSSGEEQFDADPASLLISDEIPEERIRSGGPVEHLMPGSSPEYRSQRRKIVAKYYDVQR